MKRDVHLLIFFKEGAKMKKDVHSFMMSALDTLCKFINLLI